MGKLNFYRDEPLFGLDIGYSNIKVMQLEQMGGKGLRAVGYGFAPYPPDSIVNGIISKHDALAKCLHELVNKHLVGAITTNRVACTVPTSRTFSRLVKLPLMDDEKLAEAVRLETEQYIPVRPENLYIDYEVVFRAPDGIELLVVATPRNIIDSYMKFLASVGLEPVALEPTMNACSRLFSITEPTHNQPSILVDFGSATTDLAVFDRTIFVNSIIPVGSDNVTAMISKYLKVDTEQAYQIKNKQGLEAGENQALIKEAVEPMLENLVREIRKIMRYHDERTGRGRPTISQIITLGGGSLMPGLSKFLWDQLQMPVHMLDPWNKIDFSNMLPPAEFERPMYLTVAGEAVLKPEEIFA